MTDQQTGGGRPPTEEELRAAYEAELKRIHVDDVLVQTVVSLLNLGGRRAGLGPGGPTAEDERDLEQVRSAIEGVRALLPLVEHKLGGDAAQLRQALSQLQLTYARLSGTPAPAEPERAAAPEADQGPQPGPAQSSGKLWIPGQ
jgi:hypothetical protein